MSTQEQVDEIMWPLQELATLRERVALLEEFCGMAINLLHLVAPEAAALLFAEWERAEAKAKGEGE